MNRLPSPPKGQNYFEEAAFRHLAERFKLLGEPSRLQILAALCQQERKVSDICEYTGLQQANVSRHLSILKIANIVACRKVGICHYYRIIDQDLLALCHQSFANCEHLKGQNLQWEDRDV
ncbi:ArsR/SmtB family transcription factor [Lyngbya confervoides]|uniref:Metalloregulator ArsR/SmtB family transcription factor n=1 Tax=Lyngbya confervoides BDU141951 TaxID=1574623 RepID=A0ABD4T0Z5_9CYAN|nr:metalloregulator ArsR/SmtB family transcription factor [Lyngbya confervoides]MCM1982446.1 metalloregulator ArsR/SmtB family transcription factor [Lyngbya confervoides BDU141951]